MIQPLKIESFHLNKCIKIKVFVLKGMSDPERTLFHAFFCYGRQDQCSGNYKCETKDWDKMRTGRWGLKVHATCMKRNAALNSGNM